MILKNTIELKIQAIVIFRVNQEKWWKGTNNDDVRVEFISIFHENSSTYKNRKEV